MGKWMDLALQLEQEAAGNGLDDRDNRDISPPIVANVANVHAGPSLPPDLVAGLNKLRTMRTPRVQRPQLWGEIVGDALRIEAEGWAGQALSLGWHPLQLFGCSPAVGGDPDLASLAVWLDGRKMLLIDERSAVAADGDRRACFIRRKYDGAAFLWDLADIQSRRARKL